MKDNRKGINILKLVYCVGLIGLTLYSFGYIFGEWLATGQIDVSTLNILLPMVLGLPALLLIEKESNEN
ncbi:hypothetical protein ACS6YF_05530 [Streptococcus suis]